MPRERHQSCDDLYSREFVWSPTYSDPIGTPSGLDSAGPLPDHRGRRGKRYEPSLRTLRELHESPRLFEEGGRGLRPAGTGGPVAGRRTARRRTAPQPSTLNPQLAHVRAAAALSGPGQVDYLVVHGGRAQFGGFVRSQTRTHEARWAANYHRRL